MGFASLRSKRWSTHRRAACRPAEHNALYATLVGRAVRADPLHDYLRLVIITLFRTHPDTDDRIRRLLELEGGLARIEGPEKGHYRPYGHTVMPHSLLDLQGLLLLAGSY